MLVHVLTCSIQKMNSNYIFEDSFKISVLQSYHTIRNDIWFFLSNIYIFEMYL